MLVRGTAHHLDTEAERASISNVGLESWVEGNLSTSSAWIPSVSRASASARHKDAPRPDDRCHPHRRGRRGRSVPRPSGGSLTSSPPCSPDTVWPRPRQDHGERYLSTGDEIMRRGLSSSPTTGVRRPGLQGHPGRLAARRDYRSVCAALARRPASPGASAARHTGRARSSEVPSPGFGPRNCTIKDSRPANDGNG